MTVIYVDTLFLLNGIIDYLLLLAAARLAGEPLRRLRFGAAAALGGAYAVAIFLPGMSFLAGPWCKLASCVLMLVVAYGGSRRLLRQGLIFVALACALGRPEPEFGERSVLFLPGPEDGAPLCCGLLCGPHSCLSTNWQA